MWKASFVLNAECGDCQSTVQLCYPVPDLQRKAGNEEEMVIMIMCPHRPS